MSVWGALVLGLTLLPSPLLAARPIAGVPTSRRVVSRLVKNLGVRPAGGVTVVLEHIPAADPSGAAVSPKWALRFVIDAAGAVRIETDDLVLGTTAVERYPVGKALRRAPAWIRLCVGVDPRQVAVQLGLAPKVLSLGRDGRDVLWVWGAGPRDRHSAQIHVVRADGRLRRVVEGVGALALDVTLRGAFDKTRWGRRWPSTVDIRRGKATERFRVQALIVHAPPAAAGDQEGKEATPAVPKEQP